MRFWSRKRRTDYLVARLERLTRIRINRAEELNDQGELLILCIAAAYRDCCELGREDEASALLTGFLRALEKEKGDKGYAR